ncbi:TetR family transcriptional regulator [Halobacillus andaensis]|uniref:TetR family transcriptional regulator n=1 Tax=Halobacillus andaensis TaxID=1176239 RepID=A0A917B6L3_HALAA|nr:TetR/AcrR family transcriptional regulator [Halobacillus andaensis]MBP2005995.1 AcrR family transcriptional regulator [Halobacillus andaensis]GGF24435.1 TetR family transcriptional regulator [Halobacillus andaensis]
MTEQRIIDASLECFAHSGYQNTSLADIADKVGIKKPSLYNHFSSKEAIFLRVLDEVAQKELNHLKGFTEYTKDRCIKEQIHEVFNLYVDHMSYSTEGAFFKRFTFFPPEEFADEIHQVFVRTEEQVIKIIGPIFQKGIDSGVIRPLHLNELTSAFYTIIDGLFLEENFYDRATLVERQRASFKIFWLGIQAASQEE